jgi:hypothetical protein
MHPYKWSACGRQLLQCSSCVLQFECICDVAARSGGGGSIRCRYEYAWPPGSCAALLRIVTTVLIIALVDLEARAVSGDLQALVVQAAW